MKKKLLSLILTCGLLASSLSVSAAETDIAAMTLDELQAAYTELQVQYAELQAKYDALAAESETAAAPTLDPESFGLECEDGIMQYLKYELSEDYEGNPTVILYFNYTNTSGETTNAGFSFLPKVFQNGVACEDAILFDSPEQVNARFTDIQNGYSIDVAFPYVLTDMSDITLELNEVISFSDPISTVISLQ